MDKLNALAMFVATAETGSFSRGAERLGKTPSALTKAVAHLEAELGARLFERTTRSLALTEAGQIYLEAARQSLETLRTAGQEIELLESELRGELRLAAPPSFAAAFLQQACASFLEAHPRISLRVDLDETFLDLSEGGPAYRPAAPATGQRQLRLPARPPAGRAGPAVLPAVERRAAAR